MFLQKAFLFFFLQILQYSLAIQLSKEQEQNIPIFQPFPYLTLDPISICSHGLTSSVAIFEQQTKKYVAISLTECGIFIYDITDLDNPNLTFRNQLNSSGKTLGISVSHQNKYVWASHSTGKFYGIDVAQQPFKIIIEGNSNQNFLVNKIFPWSNDNNILFIVCNQQFQIFDWRNKDKGLLHLKSVNVETVNAKKIKFLRNNQYALVSTPFKGVLFYKVDNGDDIDKINFIYSCVLKPTYFDVSDFQIIDDDTIAVMMVYTGIFMHSMKNYFDAQGQSCIKNIFPLLAKTPAQGFGGNIFISKKKFLYAQYRTVGIKIYDVSSQTLQIVQEIKVIQNCKDILLNNEEDLLYYSNSVSLQIFKRTSANFNRQLPNLLLNTYQQQSYNFYKESLSGSYDLTCLWREDKQQLFLARSSYGGLILKYSGQGILEEQSSVYRQQSEYSVSDMLFLSDGVTAYYPRLSNGFSIVDFSNPTSPQIKREKVTMDAPTVNFGFFKLFKKKPLGVVSNLQNGLIFSVQDPLNPVIISTVDTMAYTFGEVSLQTMYINDKEDTIFFIVSTYGIVVVDVTDPSKPYLLSKYFTDGASDVKLTSDSKYALIAANYAGFIITEFTEDRQLKFVSKTLINGNCYKILQFEGDQFVIITSYEDPTISLMSISDVRNPRIIQKISKPNAFAFYQMCISQDKSELFITSQYALYLLQIQPKIILHTQMYQLISKENSNEYTRKNLEGNTPLKIGQKIELLLVPIYQTQEISIRKAFYYEEFVLQDLPPWMNFYPTDRILKLNVSKDSLKKNDAGQFIDTISQVVFLTYQSISKNAFVNSYLKINSDDSTSLYNACQQEGFLDSSGFVQETYTPSKTFNLGSKEDAYLSNWKGKTDLVKRFIQNILNQNIINYTTQLKISQSLNVDLKNPDQYIQTLQNDIIVGMIVIEQISNSEKIQSNKAKFVKKNYSGVLVLISDKQDEMKLEGTLKNVNLILKSGIKFFLDEQEADPNKIFIQITISDNVNYNYEDFIPYKELSFLSLQSQIMISTSLSIQNDLFSKYPNGELFIQESFSYQISSDLFQSKDEKTLQYFAKVKIGNEFTEIPKDYWIQFSSTDRMFSGIPNSKDYNKEMYIQVNATDGYSYKVDTFKIIPNKIPFTYILQLAFQIFGPIIGLLGLYRYKHIIYNIFYKERYTYSKDIAYVGEYYRKQIVITDNKKPAALKLFGFFLNRVGIDELKNQVTQEIQKPGIANNFQYINPDIDIEQSLYSLKNQNPFQDEIMKKMYPYGVNSEDVPIFDKKLQNVLLPNSQNLQMDESKNIFAKNIIPNDIIMEKSVSQPEKNQNQILDKSQASFNNHKQRISQIKESTENSKFKVAIQNLQRQTTWTKSMSKTRSNSNIQRFSTFQEPIFKNDGRINFPKILKFIHQELILQPNNKKEISTSELKQLENPTSILSQEYLLNLCPTTKRIYECMKSLAIGYYKEIDWYKAYVNISPQFNDTHTNPYPEITICESTVRSALINIFKHFDKIIQQTKTKQQRQINFSLVLIEECIKAKAIGFSFEKNNILQVTRGESLHTYTHNIHSVKAYEQNNSIKCCYGLYEKLDIHYQQKGLTDNDKLPEWIQGINLINGSILFGGMPQKKDIGSVIIKVFHQDHYILRSFEIQILQKEIDQQEMIRFKKCSNVHQLENKDSNIYQNNYEVDTMISSQNIFKKKKSIDYQYDRSVFPNIVKNSNEMKNQISFTGNQNDSIHIPKDQIIENNEREYLYDLSSVPRLLSQESFPNKQFRLSLKQDTLQTNQDKPFDSSQNNLFTSESPHIRCKLPNQKNMEKPVQDQDSIISIKD